MPRAYEKKKEKEIFPVMLKLTKTMSTVKRERRRRKINNLDNLNNYNFIFTNSIVPSLPGVTVAAKVTPPPPPLLLSSTTIRIITVALALWTAITAVVVAVFGEWDLKASTYLIKPFLPSPLLLILPPNQH